MTDGSIPTVVKSFKMRLMPSKAQHAALVDILSAQRDLYNAALAERIDCYRKTGRSRSYMDQCKAVTQCRADMPEMSAVPANVQRSTLKRLDAAFSGFFSRVKSGVKAGFPRFKGRDYFRSFGFAEFSGIRFDGKRFRWSGLPGALRVRVHRALPDAKPIAAAFRRDHKGWTVSLQYRLPAQALAPTGRTCGIGVGLSSFATFDDGSQVPAPRISRRVEREMRRRQRALARCKRGSNSRRKARSQVARLHAKIANTRETFLHQLSARIVRENDLIAIEALNVKALSRGMLARSVNDASWGKFFQFLTYKAAWAGRELIAVDPRYTSQACSGCGVIVPKKLGTRWHDCQSCGTSLDRDHNASINILHRAVVRPGVHKLAVAPVGRKNLKEISN